MSHFFIKALQCHTRMQAEELSMFTPVQKASYLPASPANPVSRAGAPCSREKALSKQREERGAEERREGGGGGVVRFWVIYSGGNGLNQGLAAPPLTYFDLSSCFGILKRFFFSLCVCLLLCFFLLPSSCMFCE